MYMINETKVRMYIIVSLNEDENTMRFVQLTSKQFGNCFPKDTVSKFSHFSILPSEYFEKERKIGIISVSKMTISSTEKIVVELTPCSFTKHFSKGPFNVFTKCGVHLPKPIEDDNETEQPTEKVVELPSLNVTGTTPQSEKTDTNRPTNKKSTKTKVISLPNYFIFSYNYSMVIRLHRGNQSNYFYLSDVG